MSFSEINVPLVLDHLRPGSAYHTVGSLGDSGYASLDEYLGEWRDESTTAPTEQQVIDAWEFLDKRETTDQARRQKLAGGIEWGFKDDFGRNFSLAPASLDNWRKLGTTLAIAKLAAGDSPADPNVEVITAAGELIELPRSEAIALLAEIGERARVLQTRDLKWSAEIAAAETVDDLNQIAAAIAAAT